VRLERGVQDFWHGPFLRSVTLLTFSPSRALPAGRDGATARPSSAARRTQKAGEVAARHAVRGRAGEGHRPRSSGRPRGGRGRVRTMRRYGARSTASHLVPRLSHLVSLRPRLVLGVDVTLVNVGNTSWLAHCPAGATRQRGAAGVPEDLNHVLSTRSRVKSSSCVPCFHLLEEREQPRNSLSVFFVPLSP